MVCSSTTFMQTEGIVCNQDKVGAPVGIGSTYFKGLINLHCSSMASC